MRKEIFTDGTIWYIDKKHNNKIPNGTYKIYFKDVSNNDFQLIKLHPFLGSYDGEYCDFTELISNLNKLGVTTLANRVESERYFDENIIGIELTNEELKLLENTNYAKYIDGNVLQLRNILKPFKYEYISTKEYTAIFNNGYIYIYDENHYLVPTDNFNERWSYVYYDTDGVAADNKFMKDFICKVDDLNKFKVKTGYDSIEEFFNSDVEDDDDLDTIEIYAVDMDEPLIKLIKYDTNNSTIYKFIIDITTEDEEQFIVKTNIENQVQLNQKIKQTIEALKQYPQFSKYTNILEDCL